MDSPTTRGNTGDKGMNGSVHGYFYSTLVERKHNYDLNSVQEVHWQLVLQPTSAAHQAD
jgi:hypothetical protein